MTGVQLHLLVSHVPIVGAGFVLLLLIAATWRRERALWQAGLVGAVAMALTASLAMTSGPLAQEDVRTWLDPEGAALARTHEVAGQLATAALALLAVLSLQAWLVMGPHGPRARWLRTALVSTAALALGVGIWAGSVGGRIRHVEARAAISANPTIAPPLPSHSPLDSTAVERAGSP